MAAIPTPPRLGAVPDSVAGSRPGGAGGPPACRNAGLGSGPRTRPAQQKLGTRSGPWKVVSSVLFRLQLVESLYDHAVEFLEVIDVLALGRQPSQHVVHLASSSNCERQSRLLHCFPACSVVTGQSPWWVLSWARKALLANPAPTARAARRPGRGLLRTAYLSNDLFLRPPGASLYDLGQWSVSGARQARV